MKKEIIRWLKEKNEKALEELYARALEVKLKNVGPKIYLRGIIEISNVCQKDCFYCGIRHSNRRLKRFALSEEQILSAFDNAQKIGLTSLVFQSGERQDAKYIRFIEDIIKKVKVASRNKMGITLSLGEQTRDTYQRWFDAGAHRYLLRIETSNPELYIKLHPKNHRHDERLECLETLKSIGYQVGTGVMIGLPFQTLEDLAEDILVFKDRDIDMIGMGPYIGHPQTPLFKESQRIKKTDNFSLGLKMIAVTRICLLDVNIAATTALQALHPVGREKALHCGANVFMPNGTPLDYRQYYHLYEDKPLCEETTKKYWQNISKSISSSGQSLDFHSWGDAPHFFERKKR